MATDTFQSDFDKYDAWILKHMEKIVTKTPICVNNFDLTILQAYGQIRIAKAMEAQQSIVDGES